MSNIAFDQRVTVLPVDVEVVDTDGTVLALAAEPGETLMQVLRDAGLPVAAICGGAMSCGTCHVLVDADWVARTGTVGADEQSLLEYEAGYRPECSRLSCQIRLGPALAGLRVALPPRD